jgi:hypothetical protein
LAQLIVFASWTPISVAPDEDYHHNLAVQVEVQRNAPFWQPRDTERTYGLGPVSVNAHLYHQLSGFLLALKPSGLGSYVWLRFWNIVVALATLLVTWRAARAACEQDWRGAAAVVLLVSSTLMWVFLGATVSYDNLTNFLGTLALAVLWNHVKAPTLASFSILAGISAFGALVKIVFVPLGGIIVLLAGVANILAWKRRKRQDLGSEASNKKESRRKGLVLTAASVGFAIFFGSAALLKYGSNIVLHKSFTPGCEAVMPAQTCERRFNQYRDAKERERLHESAPRIPFPLFVKKYVAEVDSQWDDLHGYVYVRVRTPWWRTALFWVAVVGGGIVAWRGQWRPWSDPPWATVALATALYAACVLAVNWRGYLEHGVFGVSIHARYFFPVYLGLALMALAPAFRVQTSSRFRTAIVAVVFVSQFLRGPLDAGERLKKEILAEFHRPIVSEPQ